MGSVYWSSFGRDERGRFDRRQIKGMVATTEGRGNADSARIIPVEQTRSFQWRFSTNLFRALIEPIEFARAWVHHSPAPGIVKFFCMSPLLGVMDCSELLV